MTSAISGRIVFKQGPRAYLDSNIRRNSLVFDTDNNILLYSPSGTNFYEFYPGQGGGVSGTVYWNDIVGEPVASISTSGLLSVADWIKFNSKADLSAIPSTSSFVTSSYVNTQIQNIPTASNSSSGILSVTDWNTFNTKAATSSIPSSASIQDLIYLYSHPEITMLSGITSTTPSATIPGLKTFPTNFIPNIIGFEIVGPSSGTYSVSGNVYGYNGSSLVPVSTFDINNTYNVDGGIYFNIKKYTSFTSDLTVLSGTVPSGIYVKATT